VQLASHYTAQRKYNSGLVNLSIDTKFLQTPLSHPKCFYNFYKAGKIVSSINPSSVDIMVFLSKNNRHYQHRVTVFSIVFRNFRSHNSGLGGRETLSGVLQTTPPRMFCFRKLIIGYHHKSVQYLVCSHAGVLHMLPVTRCLIQPVHKRFIVSSNERLKSFSCVRRLTTH